MTVLAWDGRFLAADQQADTSGIVRRSVKIRVAPGGHLIGHCGDKARGMAIENWYCESVQGRKAEFPARSKPDEWARLVVVTPDGVFEYEDCEIAMPVLDPYMAWGSGADFALGAMHAGASAEKAVEAAIAHCASCGVGVTVLELMR